MQDKEVEHDTPLKAKDSAPVWFGVVWIFQSEPFQRSANVDGGTWTPGPPPPTAVQAVVAVHDTPDSCTSLAVGGIATGFTVQPEPFHCSASGVLLPIWAPTALQLVAVGHETPLSIGWPDGVIWIAQFAPFQRSTSVSEGNVLVVENPPTAVHALAALHDTAPSVAALVPVGLGVVWIFQPEVVVHFSARVLAGVKLPLTVV
jgi:hypothetical protein